MNVFHELNLIKYIILSFLKSCDNRSFCRLHIWKMINQKSQSVIYVKQCSSGNYKEKRIESMWQWKLLDYFNDFQASYIQLIDCLGSLHD